jgi:hypothetical protein
MENLSIKRFLINAALIVIGLPYYLMAFILVIYIAIMRFLLAPIASSIEPCDWLDRFDTRFYEMFKQYFT